MHYACVISVEPTVKISSVEIQLVYKINLSYEYLCSTSESYVTSIHSALKFTIISYTHAISLILILVFIDRGIKIFFFFHFKYCIVLCP